MKKDWLIKTLALGIIVLFIGTCIIPSTTSVQIHDKNIITVDDEPGDADYTTLKEAIYHSNPGDTIEVYSGTYYEYLIHIEKDDINIKGISYELGNGNDTGKPFLVGVVDDLLYLKGNNTIISGFRIVNENEISHCISGYNIFGCVITENDFMSKMISICCDESSYINISNNNISLGANGSGISLLNCSTNIISGNIITNCSNGIYIWGSNNSIIKNNIIQRCETGIKLIGQKNIVERNHIEDNTVGIDMYSNFNIVKQNNLIDNDKNASLFFYMSIFPFWNRWFNNYWGEPRIRPYPIFGVVYFFIPKDQFHFIPWVQFDWHPAKEPYDI